MRSIEDDGDDFRSRAAWSCPASALFARVRQLHPNRRMIACARLAANLAINPGPLEPVREQRTEQQMIKAQSGITLPAMPHVMPEGVDALARIDNAQAIGPSLFHQLRIGRAAFRLYKGIVVPGFRRIDVDFGRRHVVIARQHDRNVGPE